MTVDYRKAGVAGSAVKYGKYEGKNGPISVVEGVNMVAIAQDNARYVKDGETKLVYVQFMTHPDDPTAKGQTSLSLMEHTRLYQGQEKKEYTVGLTPSQYDELVKAAGDNVTPKTDKDGKATGQVFGVKGSVFQKSSRDPESGKTDWNKPHGYMPIPATFEACDFPVAAKTKRGKDAVTRAFELTAKNREAAAKARAAEKATPEAEVEAEPELV